MVADKKAWHNGPSEAGKRCALAAEQTRYSLSPTEPYLPPDCDGVFIRGLTANDFHLMVDGIEQKIENITSENEGLNIRDNLGLHIDYAQTPKGKWSTTDFPVPHYIYTGELVFGLEARNRYDISFVPQGAGSTGCHKISVKVDRRNSIVVAREEYCASESPSDILNGSTFGNQLEQDLATGQPGQLPFALQAAVFQGDQGRGRVRIVLEFPMAVLHRQWSQDWIEHATIGVLGIIYGHDGTLMSRFSDFACCTPYSTGSMIGEGMMTMDRLNGLARQFGLGFGFNLASTLVIPMERGTLPSRYETYVDLPPGGYDLRIILSDGENFGRAETHLNVESIDGNALSLSSVMLCNRFRDAHVAEVETGAANFAPQYVPTVSKSVQVSPSGYMRFASDENLIAYFEIYKPQLESGAESGIQAHLKIVDAKSGSLIKDFPAVDAETYERPGSDVIPIAREVPISELPKGQYRLEVQASDAAGHSTPWQAAAFSIK